MTSPKYKCIQLSNMEMDLVLCLTHAHMLSHLFYSYDFFEVDKTWQSLEEGNILNK